jgi:hypothetical protein
MAKGDFIEVLANMGGNAITKRVTAEKQGRVIEQGWETTAKSQWFVAQEKTRGGTTVREVRFAAEQIISIEVVMKEV